MLMIEALVSALSAGPHAGHGGAHAGHVAVLVGMALVLAAIAIHGVRRHLSRRERGDTWRLT